MNAPVNQESIDNSRSIGAILIDAGRLKPENAERILRVSREQHLRFGDAALQLKILTQDDLEFALAQQFGYPYLAPGDTSVAAEVIAAYEPRSLTVEGLRALRTQLMLRWFDVEDKGKALAIVSPEGGEGRSWLAANLAVVFSQLGERTLLIDADMRQSRQHKIFNLDNRAGLSSLLAGRGGMQEIKKIPALLNLFVLPAGATPPNPQELLAQTAFTQLLETLATQFDIVIIDTPPAVAFADAQAVSARAGGALMVARNNVSRSSLLLTSADVITRSGAVLVGSVVNEF